MRAMGEGRWRIGVALAGLIAAVAASVWPDDGLGYQRAAETTERALNKKVTAIRFDGTPLTDVADCISKSSGVRIKFDHEALSREHLDPTCMFVTARFRDMRCRA